MKYESKPYAGSVTISAQTLTDALISLNSQRGFIPQLTDKHEQERQKAFYLGMQQMLNMLVSENYANNISVHVTPDGIHSLIETVVHP